MTRTELEIKNLLTRSDLDCAARVVAAHFLISGVCNAFGACSVVSITRGVAGISGEAVRGALVVLERSGVVLLAGGTVLYKNYMWVKPIKNADHARAVIADLFGLRLSPEMVEHIASHITKPYHKLLLGALKTLKYSQKKEKCLKYGQPQIGGHKMSGTNCEEKKKTNDSATCKEPPLEPVPAAPNSPLSLPPHTPLSLSPSNTRNHYSTLNNKSNYSSSSNINKNIVLEGVREIEGSVRGERERGGGKQGPHGPDGPPEETNFSPPKKQKYTHRRSTLPDGFALTPAMREHALRLGVPAADVEGEFEHFCDYHLSRGSLMADWPAAWRTWARNAVKFADKRRCDQRQPAPTKWRDITL